MTHIDLDIQQNTQIQPQTDLEYPTLTWKCTKQPIFPQNAIDGPKKADESPEMSKIGYI